MQREDKDMQGQMEYYSVTLSTAGFAMLLKTNISDLERPLDLFSEVSFGPWFKLSLQVCFILVFLAIYLSYVFPLGGGPQAKESAPTSPIPRCSLYYPDFFPTHYFCISSLSTFGLPIFSYSAEIQRAELPPPSSFPYLIIYFAFKKDFYWSTVDLKCCISFRCTAK